MGKTAKASKRNAGAVNPRSRAAKREASPSLNTDKSLKEIERADPGAILHSRQNDAGAIGKSKKKKAAAMKRGQRARQERGLARAEAVMDQLEKKVEGAKNRLKKRNERRAVWDEVNAASLEEQRKTPKLASFGVLESIEGGGEDADGNGGGGGNGGNGGGDGDLEMGTGDDIKLPAGAGAVKMVVVERPASASVPPPEEDEIT